MRKAFLLASLFMSTTLLSPAVYASVSDDQVTSQKLKEADGTSGQNTNSGSGVKTNHVQNLAVTNAKIADGAVTDNKISGTIAASKISGTVGNADTVDGKHAAEFAAAVHTHAQADVTGLSGALAGKSDLGHIHDASDIASGIIPADMIGAYEGVRIVHKGTANGASVFSSLADALSSIVDSSPTKRYAILVMPGVYTETANPLPEKTYVDIVGVSRAVSIISFGGAPPSFFRLATGMTLRNLTVRFGVILENSFSGIVDCDVEVTEDPSFGILVQNAQTSVERVRIKGLGSTGIAEGMSINLYQGPGQVILRDIEITGVVRQGITISTINTPEDPVRLTNLKISGILQGGLGLSMGHLQLQGANIDLQGTDCNGSSAFSQGSDPSLRSSSVVQSSIIEACSNSTAVYIEGDARIEGSIISGSVGTFNFDLGGNGSVVYIANSKITAGLILDPTGKAKLVGCHDGNYDPIPDGLHLP